MCCANYRERGISKMSMKVIKSLAITFGTGALMGFAANWAFTKWGSSITASVLEKVQK